MHELALFAGAGGGILAGKILGWKTVCAVEINPFCREVLLRRQMDGCLPKFPIWDDVRTFDGKPWRGKIDIISGGFPCQDISAAGKKAGIDGPQSGLWREMARIIGEVQPPYVFVENSPRLISNGLTRVISDLTEMGYDSRWCRLSARDVGAPHIRDRVWIYSANTKCDQLREQQQRLSRGWKNGVCNEGQDESGDHGKERNVTNIESERLQQRWKSHNDSKEARGSKTWWSFEPEVE